MDRTIAPAILRDIPAGRIEPEVVMLGNSVPVYLIQAGCQQVTKVELIFRAGSWWQSKPLVASATSAMLGEGTTSHSGEEIANLVDYYGAYLNIFSDRDHAFISLFSLSKHLDKVLPLLSEIVKTPSFPQRELDTYLKRHKQSFIVDKTRVSTLARERFSNALYGQSHPYGKMALLKDFDNISREDLADFHRTFYSSGNCSIIVSGRYNEKEVMSRLEKFFGNNAPEPVNTNDKENITSHPSRKKKIFVHKKDAIQSALRIGRGLFNKRDPEYPGMMVLNSILGGHFGSRLMQNIREKRGYTYGIGSLMVSLRNSGYLAIVSEVGTGYGKYALKEIYRELEKLRSRPVSRRELELTRSHMQGELLRGFDGPFAWSESIKSIIEQGIDTGFYYRLAETIRNITPRQIQELAEKYLSPDAMHEVVAGNGEQSG